MKDISLHLLDIIQNSIRAKCTCLILNIAVTSNDNFLTITIEDDGVGMNKEVLMRVTDPFYTTRDTRRIGLGIPLLIHSARMAGGDLTIESSINEGTKITVFFEINNVDRIPLGDVGETIATVISSYPDIRFTLKMCNETENFVLDSFEIKKILGDVSLSNYDVVMWMKDYVHDGIKLLFGGVLYEINS